MSIIDYKINGETYYTHETWLSSRQRRAWHNIPVENKNLAYYYTLSSLAVVAIGHKRIPFISTYFKQLGFYAGAAVLSVGTWLGWSFVLNSQTSSQLNSVIETNDCLYTPFWKTKEAVVNLKQKALKDNFAANRYVNRSRGLYSKRENIEAFKPDLILENPRAQELIEASK